MSGEDTAMVVFVNDTECRWLRLLLQRGFRHCFAVVRRGSSWIVCDSLKGHLDLVLLDLPPDFDLAAFYAARGHHVLIGSPRPQVAARSFALAPLTCVMIVKRILGVRAARVLTPRQLFLHLTNSPIDGCLWRSVNVIPRSEYAPSASGQLSA